MLDLSITEDLDNDEIIIKYDLIDLRISTCDFAQLTAIFLSEGVSIMEVCLCYQEQF